jgi:hypothetical protein
MPLLGGVGAQSDEQVAFPVPESPIKQSGSPLAIQAQVARLAITAGAMFEFAAYRSRSATSPAGTRRP